jgi:radical SAM-linked protein
VALTYSKLGSARWLSHLDLVRVLERAIRRAQLPVKYSEGFNPRPRISFGPPLPLGMTSEAEIAVLRMENPIDADDVRERLNAQLPEGVTVTGARIVQDGEPALQAIKGTAYLAKIVCRSRNPQASIEDAIGRILALDRLVVERSDGKITRNIDIRPSVESIEIANIEGEIAVLRIRVSLANQYTAKAAEVVHTMSGLDASIELVSLHRETLY